LKLQGLKYQEIAEQLDLSVKTVEAQMRIAFTKIREEFKDGLLLWIMLHRHL
jgi:RNA polymerase sigma-70 factor (ECF subfamily)